MIPKSAEWKLMSKGFSLLELLFVVVIIGILAGIVLPSYQGSVRKTRVSKAQHAIGLIAQAEKLFEINNNVFAGFAAATPGNANATIGENVTGIDLTTIDNDTDWQYAVDAGTGVVTATGIAGRPSAGLTVQYSLTTGIFTLP